MRDSNKRGENDREGINATFNAKNFGDTTVKVTLEGGAGHVEIELFEGHLCTFEGTTDRTLCIKLAGGESFDLADALATVADYIRRQQGFTA